MNYEVNQDDQLIAKFEFLVDARIFVRASQGLFEKGNYQIIDVHRVYIDENQIQLFEDIE